MIFSVNVMDPQHQKVLSQDGKNWIIARVDGPFEVSLVDCSFPEWKNIIGQTVGFKNISDIFVYEGCTMKIFRD